MRSGVYLAVFALVVLAVAEEDTVDDGVCDNMNNQKQSLTVKIGGKEVSIVSKDESGKCKAESELKFAVGGEIYTYAQQKSADGTAKFASEMKSVLRKLNECTVVAGAVTATVATTEFGKFSWSDMQCKCGATAVTTSSDYVGCVDVISCESVGTRSGVTMTVNFAVSPTQTTVGSYSLNTNTIKVDISVENFQYADATNYMCIEADLSSKEKFKTVDKAGVDAEEHTRGTAKVRGVALASGGGLFWAEKFSTASLAATPDLDVTVGEVADESTEKKRVTFIFNSAGAQNVYWDPELRASANTAFATVPSVVLVVLAAAASFFIRA